MDAKYSKKPLTELFLYEAARVEVVDSIVIPNLRDGRIVVFDRFYDSTIAYQGYGGGLDLKLINQMNELASEGTKPDLTFILNVPILHGIQRAKKTKQEFKDGDWQESKALEFHQRVGKGYLIMARENPERLKIINTDDSVSIEDAQNKIKENILNLIKQKNYSF